jgi:conjugal transfer pilus assembly protein TrbC
MRFAFVLPLFVLLLASSSLAQDSFIPSDSEIAAQMRKQSRAVQEALSRSGREVPGQKSVKIDAPKPIVTPAQAKTDDLNDLISRFNGGKPETKRGADLLVFVSFSVPKKTLSELSRQAKEAGAVLVLRGLKDGSWKRTMDEARAVNPTMADWEINPGLFKRFKVNAVPSIVLADASRFTPSEEGCAPDVAYASVVGDVSIEQALNVMRARAEPPLAKLAEIHLKKLRGGP